MAIMRITQNHWKLSGFVVGVMECGIVSQLLGLTEWRLDVSDVSARGAEEAWLAYQKARYPATVERHGEHVFDGEDVDPMFLAGFEAGPAAAEAEGARLTVAEAEVCIRAIACADVYWGKSGVWSPATDVLRAKLRALASDSARGKEDPS